MTPPKTRPESADQCRSRFLTEFIFALPSPRLGIERFDPRLPWRVVATATPLRAHSGAARSRPERRRRPRPRPVHALIQSIGFDATGGLRQNRVCPLPPASALGSASLPVSSWFSRGCCCPGENPWDLARRLCPQAALGRITWRLCGLMDFLHRATFAFFGRAACPRQRPALAPLGPKAPAYAGLRPSRGGVADPRRCMPVPVSLARPALRLDLHQPRRGIIVYSRQGSSRSKSW